MANKRTPDQQDQQKIQYIMGPLIEGNHIFQTIHGGPLSQTQRGALEARASRGNRPAHVGVVPDKVILIIITPPNAVVHTGSTEDTENMRFFTQRDFFKTGMPHQGKVGWGGDGELTRDNGCWGASRFVPPWQDERIVTEEEKEEAEERAAKEERKAVKAGPIAGRVKARRQQEAKVAEEEGGESDNDSDDVGADGFHARLRSNGYDQSQRDPTTSLPIEEWSFPDDEDMPLFLKYLRTQISSQTQPGFEILNNIQVFFPGEYFYNQDQELDAEAASADFDSYYTGPSRLDYRWPDSSSTLDGINKLMDEPLPFGLATLEGSTAPDYRVNILKNKRSGPGKKNVKKFNGGLTRTPYFNRATCGLPYWQPRIGSNADDNDGVRLVANAVVRAGPTAGGWSTEDVLNLISSNESSPKIVILNSCSPSLSVQRQKAANDGLDEDGRKIRKQQRKVASMSDNLRYRNHIYWNGRKNFRMLRRYLPWLGGPESNPLLPIWSGHSQFTRIDKEDLHYTHTFIGDVFKREEELRTNNLLSLQQGKPGQGNSDVPIEKTLNDANELVPALGGIYELFPALYTTAALDRRGTLMDQLRRRFIGLFGQELWEIYVQNWRIEPDNPPPSYAQRGAGGKRKRRRRKRKTKRKRRKKTKKSRRRRKKRTRRRKK